jgi:hypothetical protein
VSIWIKSSDCEASACVEVAFTKSSYSTDTGACVEVGHGDDTVLMRDSKDPDGLVLTFTPSEWDAFLAGAKDGEFDV